MSIIQVKNKDGEWVPIPVAGGGGTPVVEEKSYELIEAYTFTQEINASRSKEPDGTPYNFSAVLVKVMLNGGAMSQGANVHYFASQSASNAYKIASIWMGQVSGNHTARHEVALDKGMWKVYYTNLGTNTGSAQLYTFNTSTVGMMESEYPAIGHISIDKLPVGATVEIWGVRK